MFKSALIDMANLPQSIMLWWVFEQHWQSAWRPAKDTLSIYS